MPFSNPWADGVSTTFRATCADNTCQPQSSEVSVQKLASCTATPLTCDYYIQALNTTVTPNQETTRLTRITTGGNTYHPLTLKVLTLDGTALPTGLTYSWTVPNSTTPLTTAQIPAAHVGEYKVTITPPSGVGPSQGGGLGVCELYISLSGTPCSDITAAACSCTPDATDPSKIICNPAPRVMPSTTELLSALAPGDQITANDFIITVTSVTATPLSTGEGGVPQGQGVRFSGEGYVTPKLLGGIRTGVTVEFTGIKINPCYQLIEGTIKTKFDPSWSNVVDVDAIYDSFSDIISDFRELISTYKGSTQEKNGVESRLAEMDKRINDNPFISNDSKAALKAKYDEIAALWATLKQCQSTSTSGRLSAEKSEICPAQSALDTKLGEFEALEKATTTIEIFNSDPTEGATFGTEDIELIYVTPSGKPYLLPVNAIPIFENNTQLSIPEGCLMGFKIEGVTFQARFEQKNGKPYFMGYFSNQTATNRGNIYQNFSGQKLRNIYERYEQQQASLPTFAVPAILGSFSMESGRSALGIAGSSARNTTRIIPTRALTVAKSLSVMSWVMQGVKGLFMSPPLDVYVGDGPVVINLPVRAYEYEQTLPTTLSSQVAIPHKLPNDGGKGCGVYTIWSVSVTNVLDFSIEKYGMTCQENNGCPIDIRPHEQCREFNNDNDGRFYNWSWVIPNNPGVSKDVAHIVEKTLTAGYVIANSGELPPKHKLPCFVKKGSNIFERRVDLANKHINDSISKYGSR